MLFSCHVASELKRIVGSLITLHDNFVVVGSAESLINTTIENGGVLVQVLWDDQIPISRALVTAIYPESRMNFIVVPTNSTFINVNETSSCFIFTIKVKLYLTTLVDIPFLEYRFSANETEIKGS